MTSTHQSFTYIGGELHAEQIPLRQIAEQIGTPCYVYSRAAFEHQWTQLDNAFGDHPHLICYAVKANSNLAVINLLARLGSGFDIVSEGELRRVLKAGGDPQKTVFAGVAKSRQEIEFALQNNIRCFNVESEDELLRIQDVAQALDVKAPIAIRVNPDVDPKTHPYIATGMEEAKFGISHKQALATYQKAAQLSHISIHGIACHIGSQITEAQPFADAVAKVAELVVELKNNGIDIPQLDLGGGLGIDYQGETPPSAQSYVQTLLRVMREHDLDLPIDIEPGRYISGNAGVLLTTVEYLKSNDSKNFAIVDAGMNDIARPSLYQAYHRIQSVAETPTAPTKKYDIVGPVCESSDVLGYDRDIAVQQGDLLAVMSAGAYGWAMSSTYNSRPRPPEIMVDADNIHIIRSRETMDELMASEAILP